MLKEGKAQHHRAARHHQEGWVSLRIEGEEGVEGAKELVQLAYNNARGTMEVHESKGGGGDGPDSTHHVEVHL